MWTFIINFFLGFIISLIIFLVPLAIRKESFSAPFFTIPIGLICGFLSIFFGYYSTWILLGVYFIFGIACEINFYFFMKPQNNDEESL